MFENRLSGEIERLDKSKLLLFFFYNESFNALQLYLIKLRTKFSTKQEKLLDQKLENFKIIC